MFPISFYISYHPTFTIYVYTPRLLSMRHCKNIQEHWVRADHRGARIVILPLIYLMMSLRSELALTNQQFWLYLAIVLFDAKVLVRKQSCMSLQFIYFKQEDDFAFIIIDSVNESVENTPVHVESQRQLKLGKSYGCLDFGTPKLACFPLVPFLVTTQTSPNLQIARKSRIC